MTDNPEPMEQKRVSPTPKSELDYNMMTTDPAWGQSFIPKELRDKLSEQYAEVKKEVNIQRIELDKIEENISKLVAKGFTELSKDVFMLANDIQRITITVDRTDGTFRTLTETKVVTRDGYWEILGYYTRDLRLGNLSDGSNPFSQNEVLYCEYHLNLAGDELNYYHEDLPHGFHKAFFAHIRRVASKIEISHSKHGWFRKQGGTVTSKVEYKGVPPDPNAKKYFGYMQDGART